MSTASRRVSPRKGILLCGAGFSCRFGGYLASEMWALIFRQPEIRKSERLRRRMLEEMNFEAVYEEVMTSSAYEGVERQGLTEAVWRAYRQMHEEMSEGRNRDAAHAVVRAFISRFASPERSERGFVFTLNQDLLIETFHTGDLEVELPGLVGLKPESVESIHLPDAEAVTKSATSFWEPQGGSLAYVKLHGSFNWRRQDGDRALVIGTNKGQLLTSEPLLEWYHQLFKEVLHQPSRALLVIGYSFRDAHINDVILSAVRKSGLKLYVMSPKTPEQFRSYVSPVQGGLGPVECGDKIWESLYGYYCGSVEQYYTAKHVQLPPRGRALFNDIGL